MLTVIWLLLSGVFSDQARQFVFGGVVPVTFLWGVWWVWHGFNRDRSGAK